MSAGVTRHLAFAIDGGGGNLTYQRNLEAALAGAEGIESDFLSIPIFQHDIWELAPLIGRNLAMTASARAAAALHATAQRKPIDAALIHSQSLALFAIPLMRHVPTVISTDGTPANYDSFADALDHKVYGTVIEAAKKLWTRRTFAAAERVLGFSRWVKDSLVNDYGCSEDKVVVIPPGIDVERWRPAPATKREGPVRILFTGGQFERKGGPELLRWKERTAHRDVELHLVTQRPAPETPGVFVYRNMTPNAPELVKLAQSCDLFVLPTRGDCFGFAVIEAMALELPVVVSDVGGIRDIVDDGQTGFLVACGDFDALADRIDRLVSNPELRRSMGVLARTRAVERFDARRNAQRVLELMLGLGPARRS